MTGHRLVASQQLAKKVNRIILMTDGLANQGITDSEGLVGLAAKITGSEQSLTCIGVGDDFNEDLLTGMAETGRGNFYYLERLRPAGYQLYWYGCIYPGSGRDPLAGRGPLRPDQGMTSQVNEEVNKNVEHMKITEVRDEAIHLADAGENEAATQVLFRMLEDLEDLESGPDLYDLNLIGEVENEHRIHAVLQSYSPQENAVFQLPEPQEPQATQLNNPVEVMNIKRRINASALAALH